MYRIYRSHTGAITIEESEIDESDLITFAYTELEKLFPEFTECFCDNLIKLNDSFNSSYLVMFKVKFKHQNQKMILEIKEYLNLIELISIYEPRIESN